MPPEGTMALSFYVNGPGSYAHVDPARSLPIIAAGGFRAIDISASAGERVTDAGSFVRGERQRMRRLAESSSLSVAAVITHLGLATTIDEGRPLDLSSAIDVAVDVGAPVVAFHIGVVPARADRAGLWRATVDAVRDATSAARSAGVGLLVDAVAPDFLTRSPLELRVFLEEVDRPELGWNFDPAFIGANGWEVNAIVSLIAPWIRHVHVKDYRGDYPNQEWLIPGDGALDHTAYVRALRGIGYAGSLSAEVIARRPPGSTERWSIEHAVARSYETLSSAIAS
jgi:sugar phosphate isomerase/epimerase